MQDMQGFFTCYLEAGGPLRKFLGPDAEGVTWLMGANKKQLKQGVFQRDNVCSGQTMCLLERH